MLTIERTCCPIITRILAYIQPLLNMDFFFNCKIVTQTHFVSGSRQTLYLNLKFTYTGRNWNSLKMDSLKKGINGKFTQAMHAKMHVLYYITLYHTQYSVCCYCMLKHYNLHKSSKIKYTSIKMTATQVSTVIWWVNTLSLFLVHKEKNRGTVISCTALGQCFIERIAGRGFMGHVNIIY